MNKLNGFKELSADEHRSEFKIPVMRVELSLKVRYFLNDSGTGYCGLLIKEVKGNGLRGRVQAAVAKDYIGRTILIFLTELDDGKKLITVPALFEKEPCFDKSVDLSDLIIKTYYHDDLRKTPQEVHKEHMNALVGRKISADKEHLIRSILDLPGRGLEILRSFR
ncbi:MAG: hypothetical protein FIB08_10145 [Candidatus Methanoperedens sp.]|nr:hypothetical protein [Candidatus Methanoperedens sp.]